MNVWLLLIVLGAITFALRSVVVLGYGDRPLPALLERGAAPMAAGLRSALLAGGLWAALVHAHSSPPDAPAVPARFAAVAVGVVVARRTGSVGLTIAAGLATAALLGTAS